MSGDYSRNGFDPWLDDLGVLWQQGRPVTDRDLNDLVLQYSRRIQAGTLDTIGEAAVPAQTKAAFKIEAAGGTLTIGRGRMYVDGLLAENHGAPPANGPLSWDVHLAEQFGSEALAYAKQTGFTEQPYYPNPPALPATGGSHLVYLDVWQREVTQPMRGAIVEPALGVDTTARLQTVWQVKVLADASAGVSCATELDDFTGWLPQNAPSAGRLSTTTAQVPGQPDPCEVPPAGGYKGRENQLYRVEIHKGGAPGTATFKWSRDNASIETEVTAIPTLNQLVVRSVGRDPVLRFSDGDWIEITDDWLELNNEPGLLRRIKTGNGVDDPTRTITLDQVLPAGLFPTNAQKLTDPLRHTRIRRWDQTDKVFDAAGTEVVDPNAASGSITVPVAATTQILLEHGIVASFSVHPAGGLFRAGDYWVFAARAGDATIEELEEAPPRGIHHHYAKLGLWDPATGNVNDCRTPWPPACGGCCTLTVAPGQSIQAALDSLPPEGGCVCLKTGVHEPGTHIRMQTPSVILRGEGPGTIVRSPGPVVLLIGLKPVTDVVVESIRFETTDKIEQPEGAIVTAYGCARLRIHDCEMAATAAEPGNQIGAMLLEVDDVSFTRNRVRNVAYGVQVGEFAGRVEISHNHIEGMTSGLLGAGNSAGAFGIQAGDGESGALRVASNLIDDFLTGISIEAGAKGAVLADNRINRSAAAVQDAPPIGAAALRQYLDKRLYAIDIEAASCEARANHIGLPSAVFGGIRASAAGARLIGNILEAQLVDSFLAPLPAGIYCLAQPQHARAADGAEVRGNALLGPQAGVVVSRVDGVTVAANRVDGGGAGWYGTLADDCSDACLRENDISEVWFGVHLSEGERNRVLANRVHDSVFGITALQEADLEISGNALQSCSGGGAMAVGARRATTLLDNRLMNCAYAGSVSFGMLVLGEELFQDSGAMLRVEHCELIDTGLSVDGAQSGVPVAGIAAWVPACQVTSNRVGYTQPQRLDAGLQHRALLLIGPVAWHFSVGLGGFDLRFGSAVVNANHFRAPARTTLVEFLRLAVSPSIDFRFEKVTFSDNVCEHLSAEASPQAATVQLLGGQLIAMGNHVKASDKAVFAMSLGNGTKNVLMGNVTTGQYLNAGTVVPSPINNFNAFV